MTAFVAEVSQLRASGTRSQRWFIGFGPWPGLEFVPQDEHIRRGLDTQPNPVPRHADDRHDNIVSEPNPLGGFSRKNQHEGKLRAVMIRIGSGLQAGGNAAVGVRVWRISTWVIQPALASVPAQAGF